MAAKTKSKTAAVSAAQMTVPSDTAEGQMSALAKVEAEAKELQTQYAQQMKGTSIDDHLIALMENDAALRAVEEATDDQLSDTETDLLKLQDHEVGSDDAEVRGVFMGRTVLTRSGFDNLGKPLAPLTEIWLAVRGSDGEVRPKKMHQTATLETGFQYVAPMTPVRVRYTGSEQRPVGQLHYFEVQKLLMNGRPTGKKVTK